MASNDPNEPILIARCANEFEAELKASVLRSAGIEVRTVTTAASVLWHIGPAMGYPYDVFVKREDLERAKQALQDASDTGRQANWRDVADQAEASAHGLALTNGDEHDEEDWPQRRRGLSAPAAFALGAVFGMLSSPVPIILASLLGSPFGRPEMTVMLTLWVIAWGFLAYNIRERLPAPAPVSEEPPHPGERRPHFRDSRFAIAGWFLLGFVFFGPVTSFLPAIALFPLLSRFRAGTPSFDFYFLLAWSLAIGVWTARQGWRSRAKRRAALGIAR